MSKFRNRSGSIVFVIHNHQKKKKKKKKEKEEEKEKEKEEKKKKKKSQVLLLNLAEISRMAVEPAGRTRSIQRLTTAVQLNEAGSRNSRSSA
jgi:hypothetical protein